ncbi:MAG: hypothetical protein Q9210_007297 [Variospora velana]
MNHNFDSLHDPDSPLNVAYRKIFGSAEDTCMTNLIETIANLFSVSILLRLPVRANIETYSAAQTIRQVCRERVSWANGEINYDGGGQDILSVALRSGKCTADNMVDQMITLLAAGHEITSTAAAWALITMCKYPRMQSRLREEIRESLPSPQDGGRSSVTAEVIGKLPFLDAFCNEVLRRFPPVAITRRVAARDTTLLGHYIPQGSNILLVPAAINMSQTMWGKDALSFNPDRWLQHGKANNGGARSNYANLTFLHGPVPSSCASAVSGLTADRAPIVSWSVMRQSRVGLSRCSGRRKV